MYAGRRPCCLAPSSACRCICFGLSRLAPTTAMTQLPGVGTAAYMPCHAMMAPELFAFDVPQVCLPTSVCVPFICSVPVATGRQYQLLIGSGSLLLHICSSRPYAKAACPACRREERCACTTSHACTHAGMQALPGSDSYAFGVLLWELLAGQAPWAGMSQVQIAAPRHLARRSRCIRRALPCPCMGLLSARGGVDARLVGLTQVRAAKARRHGGMAAWRLAQPKLGCCLVCLPLLL